ncbi:hypothetical protein [Fundicoccus culcitae]|uniref:ABC transporter permease n=1 Tax=Fundicoccus culcitae TaxID=2969821 RepID=A0ABY5P855_9LACT|nr:hypothetical protein [Fundicoccus culcitae]UUX34931.1 hypothetical protein NRE15_04605 [Fundicoccus culcitae]
MTFKLIFNEFSVRFFNIKTIISIIVIAIICIVAAQDEMIPGVSVSYLINHIMVFSHIQELILVASAFPVVMTFCDDWEHRFTFNQVIRTNTLNYAISKVTLAFFGSFLVTFIGLFISVGVLLLWFPLYIPHEFTVLARMFPAYSELVFSAYPVTALLLKITVFSYSMGFWTSLGLLLSTYIPNRLVVLVSPYILRYYLGYFMMYLPGIFNEEHISESYPIFFGEPWWVHFSYFTLYYFVLFLLILFFFKRQLEKRVRNESA